MRGTREDTRGIYIARLTERDITFTGRWAARGFGRDSAIIGSMLRSFLLAGEKRERLSFMKSICERGQ